MSQKLVSGILWLLTTFGNICGYATAVSIHTVTIWGPYWEQTDSTINKFVNSGNLDLMES